MDKNELDDAVEGLVLEILASDKREEFVAALLHDGFDPEWVKELAEETRENKTELDRILSKPNEPA